MKLPPASFTCARAISLTFFDRVGEILDIAISPSIWLPHVAIWLPHGLDTTCYGGGIRKTTCYGGGLRNRNFRALASVEGAVGWRATTANATTAVNGTISGTVV